MNEEEIAKEFRITYQKLLDLSKEARRKKMRVTAVITSKNIPDNYIEISKWAHGTLLIEKTTQY